MPNSPWTEQRTVASDGAALAWFGSSVAISDGWALIGARNANVDGHTSQGAVYVFQQLANGWRQAQKLTGKGSGAGDQFGVTIAMQGNLAMITAPYAAVEGGIWRGVVHVFRRDPAVRTWRQTQVFHSDDVTMFGTLGVSIATNGEYAFVGAGGANQGGHYLPRQVYVFRHTDPATDTWTQIQVLETPTPLDPTDSFADSDPFGTAVWRKPVRQSG